MKKYEYYYERKAKHESYKPIENIDNIVYWTVMTPMIIFLSIVWTLGNYYK